MEINVFSVHPFGMAFPTSDLSVTVGDMNCAFYKAHLCAARQAAQLRIPSYVLRDDMGLKRMGFGEAALSNPTSDLNKIMRLGLGSAWDYSSASWVPLPIQEEWRVAELTQTC